MILSCRAPLGPCGLFGLALVAAGCHTITEDLPTRANQVPLPTASQPAAIPGPVVTPAPSPAPTPSATPAPAPTPEPAENPGRIDSIRVGFFGIKCPKGTPTPNNGWKQLPAGCRGFVTATPKDKNNIDVPPKEHGPHIRWELDYGDSQVDVLEPSFPSDFKRTS